MELVGDTLEVIEKALGLDSKKIRKNLKNYLAEQAVAETNRPPDPGQVAQRVTGIWRSWFRWRLGGVEPQVGSQRHLAAGLGYATVEELEAAVEAVNLGKPLPGSERPADIVNEGRGLVSRGFDKPGLVSEALLNHFSSRLAALPEDARDYIRVQWEQFQQRAAQLDKEAAEFDRFLNLSSFRAPKADPSNSS